MTSEEMNATCTSKGKSFESKHKTSTLTLSFCFFNNNRNVNGTCSFDGLPSFVYNCSSNIAKKLTEDFTPTNSYCSSSSLNIHSSDSTTMTATITPSDSTTMNATITPSDSTTMNATITPLLDAFCSATSLIIVFGLISSILLVLCLILFTILLVYCYKYRHMKSSNVISFTPGKILYIMGNHILCYIIRSWNVYISV